MYELDMFKQKYGDFDTNSSIMGTTEPFKAISKANSGGMPSTFPASPTLNKKTGNFGRIFEPTALPADQLAETLEETDKQTSLENQSAERHQRQDSTA